MAATILCADDDRNYCRILSRALHQQGYQVETVHDGEAALARIQALDPALVTLDVMLPKRDGFSVLEALRARGSRHRQTPVILLSACTFSRQYEERASRLGANAVLTKPVPLQELLGAVSSRIGGKGSVLPTSTELSGSLEEIPFAPLLHQLHGLRATGVLQVQRGKRKKQLQLRAGSPVAVKSNLVNETLGHLLVATGTITWDVLHESMRRMQKGEGRQGQILKAMHMLDDEDLARALYNQAREKLFELFTWPRGSFRFHRGARLRGANALSLRGSTPEVILEGIRWRVPLEVIDSYLRENARCRPVPGRSPFYRFQAAPWSELDRAWLERFDGRLRLGEVVGEEEEVRRSVYALLTLERLELGEGRSPAGARHLRSKRARPPLRGKVRRLVERRRKVQDGEQRVANAPLPQAAIRSELAEMAERFRSLDCFGILGVDEAAGDAEIREAYAELAKRTHPDRFAAEGTAVLRLAEEVFGQIARAYETVGERQQRLTYLRDRKMRERDAAELEEGHRALRAELAFQKGEQALRARSYAEAVACFRAAVEAYPKEGEYQAYYGWALYLVDPQAPGRQLAPGQHQLQGFAQATGRSPTCSWAASTRRMGA